jgi:hypothetical protein
MPDNFNRPIRPVSPMKQVSSGSPSNPPSGAAAGSSSPAGVIVPPSGDGRWNYASRWLGNERLHWLEVMLDEAFVVPGTSIRFGIDGIVGLIPGLGDVLAGLLSLIIPLAGWVRGVPYVTLLRMLANLAIGVLVGTIPIVGDAFDIFWKANRRNYRLLTRSLAAPHRHTWRDWLFLLLLVGAVGLLFALPILLFAWLLAWLFSGIGGR